MEPANPDAHAGRAESGSLSAGDEFSRRAVSAEDRYFELPDGRRIHLKQWRGRRPTCLLLHGFGDGAYIWEEVAQALRANSAIAAMDLCGHGDSSWSSDGRYTTDGHVADARWLIDSCLGGRVLIIGHSLGADVAIRLAARHPSLVSGLVIVDFGVDMSRETGEYARRQFANQLRVYSSIEEYASTLATSRPLVSTEVAWRVAKDALRKVSEGRYLLKCDPQLIAARDDDLEPRDKIATMGAVRCPVLLVRGRASAALSLRAAIASAKYLRAFQVRLVSDAGHAVVTDNPGELAQFIAEFVNSMRQGRFLVRTA